MSNSPQHRLSNRGGGYVEAHEVVPAPPHGHLLRLRGPTGAVAQICLTDPRYTAVTAVHARGTHHLRGAGKTPTQATESLLDLLGRILTLPCSNNVDFAIALDWYKTPVDGLSPRDWPFTSSADLAHRGKYWYDDDPKDAAKQRKCGLALVDRLSAVISQHPLLSATDAVVAVPGHDARRVSFGARLAAAIARHLAKPLVRCAGLAAFRTPAKSLDLSARASMIANQFVCSDELTGLSLLIIDDIYSSGSTVAETARVVREAGATNVACLCAVRTMRSP